MTTKNQIKSLISEVVKEELIKENLISLKHLNDGISNSTITGKSWGELVNGLESVINEMKDFPSLYPSSIHGPTPNTRGAMIQLQLVVNMLQSIKPVILGMVDIEKKDYD